MPGKLVAAPIAFAVTSRGCWSGRTRGERSKNKKTRRLGRGARLLRPADNRRNRSVRLTEKSIYAFCASGNYLNVMHIQVVAGTPHKTPCSYKHLVPRKSYTDYAHIDNSFSHRHVSVGIAIHRTVTRVGRKQRSYKRENRLNEKCTSDFSVSIQRLVRSRQPCVPRHGSTHRTLLPAFPFIPTFTVVASTSAVASNTAAPARSE